MRPPRLSALTQGPCPKELLSPRRRLIDKEGSRREEEEEEEEGVFGSVGSAVT